MKNTLEICPHCGGNGVLPVYAYRDGVKSQAGVMVCGVCNGVALVPRRVVVDYNAKQKEGEQG